MKKLKIVPTVLMFVLCVGVLAVGIYAVGTSSNNIFGTITINAANEEVEITAYLNSIEEKNRISKTVTTRAGTVIELNSTNLTFDASSVNNVKDLNKKSILLEIKNNSTKKDLGAYFLTGTVSEEGTKLVNIATNKQLDGTMGEQNVEDVVTARFTHYTQIPKNQGKAVVECEMMLNQFYDDDVVVPLNLSVNIEEYDPSLAIVSDGTAWLTGTEAPTNSLGETYDFYLDTDDLNIYKKEESGWALLANIKGEKGDKPTIEINELGFWVIDGQLTNIKADCGIDNLKTELNGILDLEANNFEMTYEPFKEGNMGFSYDTSTFSGWGGSIGKPQSFDSLLFKTRARDNAITKINVYLCEENIDGNLLYSEELIVNILPDEVGEIVWKLPEVITNIDNINYYFAYACNNLCDLNKDKWYADIIPANENQVLTSYITSGKIGLKNFQITPASVSSNFFYLNVKAGISYSTYKFNENKFKEMLSGSNLITFDNSKICLPKTIYGYVGQTMQIYFHNIMAYSIDDVLISVTSSSKGNQYKDRWEYTPTGAETFSLNISIYSKNFDLLQKSVFDVVIKDSTTSSAAKVLVIGDSTVESAGETGKMFELSGLDENFDLTLLGTLGSGGNKHEGRGGWSAKSYVSTESTFNSYLDKTVVNSFYNPETSTFDFTYYMTQQSYDSVDVVFLQLGINDIFGAKTESALQTAITTFTTNLNIMIESIKLYNASIKIVINLIIPCTNNQDAFTAVYGMSQTTWCFKKNMYFANLALLEKFSDSENVYLSWYNAAIDIEANQTSDVHPSQNGYYQLGEQMYYMLKAIS